MSKWSKPWLEHPRLFWFVYVPIVAVLVTSTAAGEFYTALHIGYDPITNPEAGIFIYNDNGKYTVKYQGRTLPVQGTVPFDIPNGACYRLLASADLVKFVANVTMTPSPISDCVQTEP